MTALRVHTKGRAIYSNYGNLHRHPRNYSEMANFELKIGDVGIEICFESWQEMIAFCDKHNFSYEDQRTGVDKYLDRMSCAS